MSNTEPKLKCIKPATYVWYDNQDDFAGWVVKDEAEYAIDEDGDE